LGPERVFHVERRIPRQPPRSRAARAV
jgi:hypothetical protein